MAKQEADWFANIKVWWLLKGFKNTLRKTTNISWGDNGSMGSVGCDIEIWKEASFVRFYYTNISSSKEYDYKVKVVKTPCHFGGHRFWFICPLISNGMPCNKRVGVLYMVDSLFGCRNCHNLTYSSRNISGISKAIGKIISSKEIREIAEEINRVTYRKKYTKKFSRLLKKYQQYKTKINGTINILKESVEKTAKKNQKVLDKVLKNN